MSISKKKINDVTVKPIPKKKLDKKIKGYDLFPEIYANIFICAKKKSGKTTTIFKILKECCGKDTQVIAFVATHLRDPSYKVIKQWLDDHEISNMFYTSMYEGRKNILEEYIKNIQIEEDSDDDSVKEEEEEDHVLICEDDYEIKFKKRKPTYVAPKIIFLFDDLSDELKSPVIASLIKTNRQYKSKCIFSSQYVLDLATGSRRNIDYYLIFGGINDEKLDAIYTFADLRIDKEDFERLYKEATKERFHFLYVDTINSKFRIDFNTSLEI